MYHVYVRVDGDSDMLQGLPLLPVQLARNSSSGSGGSRGSRQHSPLFPSKVTPFTFDPSLDTWGIGAVLCEVFTGRPPWSDNTTYAQFVKMAYPGNYHHLVF